MIHLQNWLQDTLNTSTGDRQRTVSGFPTMQLSNDTAELYYYAYRGYMSGYDKPSKGRWVHYLSHFAKAFRRKNNEWFIIIHVGLIF
jgi:hypothetical protein